MSRFTQLVTPRLVLRRLGPGDGPAVAAYRGDPEIARFHDWRPEDGEAALLSAWFADHADDEPACVDGPGLLLAITRRADGVLCGDLSLRCRAPGEVEGDEPPAVELGYTLAPAHHGHGLATEAARVACAWALATLDVARVVAVTDARNLRSIALLERLGMVRVATRPLVLRGATSLGFEYALDRRG